MNIISLHLSWQLLYSSVILLTSLYEKIMIFTKDIMYFGTSGVVNKVTRQYAFIPWFVTLESTAGGSPVELGTYEWWNHGRHARGGGCGGASILIEATSGGEDDGADLDIAEDSQLTCLLQQAMRPLGEGNLPAAHLLNPLNHNLAPRHASFSVSLINWLYYLCALSILPPTLNTIC